MSAATRKKLAIVFCAHHKPWLMMSTLLTLVSQEAHEADWFVAYNVGSGEIDRPSYAEYHELAARAGINVQLSPFDERVREVCHINGPAITEIEYENDHGLDSGCWYKFIRDGAWRGYDYTLCIHEGMLLANPQLVKSLMSFAVRRNVHFIASGHEKRRVPRMMMGVLPAGHPMATEMDDYHRRMIEETFRTFCRDPEFLALYESYGSDFIGETQHHVPGVQRGRVLERRLRARVQKEWGSAYTNPNAGWAGNVLREGPHAIDRLLSRMRMTMGIPKDATPESLAYVGGSYNVMPVAPDEELQVEHGVAYHRVEGPEWFGCATNHLMSFEFLDAFSERLNRYQMFEMLELPFAGSALEVIWGFLPAWLGFEKWFTNGFHRVRKQFSTYQREDYPPEMASYINRYHRGRLVVDWQDDFLKLRAWHPQLGDLRRVLPSVYF